MKLKNKLILIFLLFFIFVFLYSNKSYCSTQLTDTSYYLTDFTMYNRSLTHDEDYQKDHLIFIDIICNILSILEGTIYDIKDINIINKNESFKIICTKL